MTIRVFVHPRTLETQVYFEDISLLYLLKIVNKVNGWRGIFEVEVYEEDLYETSNLLLAEMDIW